MNKNEYFKEVTNCPKFKALNTRLNKKTRKCIFNAAWDLYLCTININGDPWIGMLNNYNLNEAYSRLIDMYLKIHPELNIENIKYSYGKEI